MGSLRETQETLLRLTRLGEAMSTAAKTVADPRLAGNSEIMVLFHLALHGPSRPSELQQLTGYTSGGVTKVLERLEEIGVVQRQLGQVPADRRAVIVTLTPEGERAATVIAHTIQELVREVPHLVADLLESARSG